MLQSDQAVLTSPETQTALWFLGVLSQVRVSGEQTGGAFSLTDNLARRWGQRSSSAAGWPFSCIQSTRFSPSSVKPLGPDRSSDIAKVGYQNRRKTGCCIKSMTGRLPRCYKGARCK